MSILNVRDLGDGPVVILLHAFPCDGRMWQPVAESLAASGLRVIVPDLPGFGGSPLIEAEPGLDAVADVLIAMLAERDIDRCVLGGVSLGGYLTMAILRRRPDLAAAVVLCDTKATADAPEAAQNRERLAALCLAEPDRTGRILEQAVLPGLIGDTSRADRPEVVSRVRDWLDDARAESVAWYQRAMAARPDSLDVLGSIDSPVLVMWGDEDALSPREEQDLMLGRLALGDSAVIEGAGHLANVERPAAVAAALRSFVTSLQSG
jgi:pimeloyl-ACP methyl ester carboxylesterase